MTEVFGFLFFGIIVVFIILIAVNFIKEFNKLRKLYEKGLIANKVLEENKEKF